MSGVTSWALRGAVSPTALGRSARRGLRWGNVDLRAGTALLVVLLVGSVVASMTSPDPNAQELGRALAPPGSSGHSLGTDPLGRDVLAWTAGGIRSALVISFSVVLVAAIAGVLIGTIAGYFGGWVDGLLMRVVDLQLAVPPLLLFLAVSAVVRPTIVGLVALLSVVSWVPYARLVRARIQAERDRPYISAARLAGSGHARVIARHLLPSAVSIVLVVGSLQAGYVLLWESALSFLGLGVQPPSTSLGFMIAAGQTQLAQAWWVAVFPGLTILLLVFAFNLIGDGLRDRFQLGDAETGVR